MTSQSARARARDERGSISIWLVTASFLMILLVGLAVDLGGQVHAQQRAHHLAAQAARAGADRVQASPAIEGHELRVSTVTARAAAADYLAAAEVDGSVVVVGGHTVRVQVHDTYTPVFLGVIGLGERTVTGDATARIIRTLGGSEQ